MNTNWKLKTFEELTRTELYAILRLRSSIFVIDQQCFFEEIDGKDQENCYHLFYESNTEILAYARIFAPNAIYAEPCLSRVCIRLDQRGKGLGKELMRNSLTAMYLLYPEQPVKIAAQCYLKRFYERFGFEIAGDVYMEDNIEHVLMLKYG